MIHWEPSDDNRGFAVWLRYVECGHWGLVLTAMLPRYFYFDRAALKEPTP